MKRIISIQIIGAQLLWMAAGAVTTLGAQEVGTSCGDEQIRFDIPRQRADSALTAFAQQAKVQLLFPVDRVEAVAANPLVGDYSVCAGLSILLAGTGLRAAIDVTGQILVQHISADEEQGMKMHNATKKTYPKRWLAGLLAFLGGGGAGNVMAQEVGASGALEEIIVTARRREESLMETPVSITAFSGADLQARQIDSVDQIAQATPGFVFMRDAGQFNSSSRIFIRGVGQVEFLPTQQPGVGLYVDDAYIAPWAGSLLDMLDIEAVEVLRGPQGTLFGRNTIGGAVQVNTVKPSNEFSADVEALAGRFDRWRVKGQVNVPITDTFYAKFSGLYQEKKGFINTPNIPDDDGLGGDDIQAARLALRWVPSDALTIDLSGEYSKQQSNGRPTVLGAPPLDSNPALVSPVNPSGWTQAGQYNNIVAPALGLPLFTATSFLGDETYTSLSSTPSEEETEVKGVNLTVQWDVSDNLTLKSISGYRNAKAEGSVDVDNSQPVVTTNTANNDGEHWSQEFRLSGVAFDQRLNWLAGLYYYEEKVTNLEAVGLTVFDILSGSKVDNQSAAVFGQATYDFTDQWSLTLGGRYTDEQLTSIVDDELHYVTRIFVCFVPGPTPGSCAAGSYVPLPAPPAPGSFKITTNGEFESNETQFEPYLNLTHHFTEDLMAYVSYSEGFKGGGFTQRVIPGQMIESFKPEFAQVYEIGSKWSGDRLQVSGALFYNDYTELQVQTLRVAGGTTENAADAVIKGGELEVQAAVTDRLRLSAGVSYLEDEYKSVDPAVIFSADSRIPFVREWQVNAAASYRLPLPTGELIARLDYFYSDDYFVEAENLPELFFPSYYLLNAGLTYVHSSERWEVGVQGRNITDEYYKVSGISNLNLIGFTQDVVGPPAEWSVRFGYHF